MILCFDKPKKARSTEEHNRTYSSDSGIDGTYVPNMSDEDMFKWKAKKIGGSDPRVEIRKTVQGKEPGEQWARSAQVLIVVRPDGSVVMSANGRMIWGSQVFQEFTQAVNEAVQILQA